VDSDSDSEETFDNNKRSNEQIDMINNKRFTRHKELISKSKYRTIFKGFDNESGCEIAWSCYKLKQSNTFRTDKLREALGEIQKLQHKHILNVVFFEVRK